MAGITDMLGSAREAEASYLRTGRREYLDEAIVLFHKAMDHALSEGSNATELESGLANALRLRGEYFGEATAMQEAAELGEHALLQTAPDHTERPARLACLAQTHLGLYVTLQDVRDLEKGKNLSTQAINLAPTHHPDLPLFQYCRGHALQIEAVRAGSLDLMNAAIDTLEDAANALPAGHRARHFLLRELAITQMRRLKLLPAFERDVDRPVETALQAVRETPEGSAYKHRSLTFLSMCFYMRFYYRSKSLEDLQQAIHHCKAALHLLQPDNASWMTNAGNLSMQLWRQFQMTGSLSTLDTAMDTLRKVLDFLPPDHRNRANRLSFFGQILIESFRNRGRLSELDDAIACQRKAILISPAPEKPQYLIHLGGSLLERFLHQRERQDINEAISILRDSLSTAAVALHGPARAELARALTVRSDYAGCESDLEEAIALFGEVIQGGSDVFDIPAQLSLYGIALQRRHQKLEDMQDLHAAINVFEKILDSAIARVHNGALARQSLPLFYSRLGESQHLLYTRTHDRMDIDDAVDNLVAAVDSTSEDHPLLAFRCYELSSALITRHLSMGAPGDLRIAIATLQKGAQAQRSIAKDRFNASLRCANLLHEQGDLLDALEAYKLAINFLPRVAWLGLEQNARYEAAHHWNHLGSDAAACAIAVGQLELAVELLEAGRSVIWNQMYQLRQEHRDLTLVAPELAKELEEVGRALESSMRRSVPTDDPDEFEAHARRHRRLAERWDDLMDEVHTLPGTGNFLRMTPFDRLRPAASVGPVILINASRYRSDGLIVTRDHAVRLFHLASLRVGPIDAWAQKLYFVLSLTRDKAGAKYAEEVLLTLLDQLWHHFGRPLWDALRGLLPTNQLGRIWLVPIGALASLPLHASMPYATGGTGFPDLVLASYTPTLSALIRSRAGRFTAESRRPGSGIRMLAVGQPNVPNRPVLECWVSERNAIFRNFPRVSVTLLEHQRATKDRVLEELRSHNFFHICSHGEHDWDNPFNSRLRLHDAPLHLADIVKEQFTRADFAFLSACHTARVDLRSPDESVHLASGMHLAGFRSIIATMWCIADKDAPAIARLTYSHLTRGNRTPDYTEAAEALHHAVTALRRSKVPAFRWVPFIHIGT